MLVIKPALHHVTFKTTRLDEMMAWYGTVLGGIINFKDDHNGWMTNDEANHRFAFLSVPGLEDDPDKVKHNAMHHCAFEYENFSDLMSSYSRMRDAKPAELPGEQPTKLMSASGTKRTSRQARSMSAFGGKADMMQTGRDVCFDRKRT
jgi:hypothetical protein